MAPPEEEGPGAEAPQAQRGEGAGGVAEEAGSLLEVTLEPGRLGLTAERVTGRLLSIEPRGQAASKGVRMEWAIYRVNGQPFSKEILDACMSGSEPYVVGFKPKAELVVSLTFEPGPLGLRGDKDSGLLLSVSAGSQAARQGVRPEWQLNFIDGRPYSDELLREKIAGTAPYTIGFKLQDYIALEFEPGTTGLKLDDAGKGKVTAVSEGGQASSKGVAVGWTVCFVGSQPFTAEAYRRATEGNASFVLSFKSMEDLPLAGDPPAREASVPAPVSTPPASPTPTSGRRDGPVQFISIDDAGRCHLKEEAVEILNGIPGRLAVVGVAGLYRTGKSFLLNRLLGSQDGFEIGPTVNACTKGIWMWGEPIKLDEDYHCVLLDTEGLGSAQRTASCDMQIFSLCILLSSYFIYNSMGAIDEQAIDDLHLVVHLAKHIHTKSGDANTGEAHADLAQNFPSFLWVLRDFHLKLQDPSGNPISEGGYLESALAPIQGQEDKNKVRTVIKELFTNRDCITLVRPLASENELRNIQKVPYEKLREPFRKKVEDFVQKVFHEVHPKEVSGAICTASMFTGLAREYCQAINNSVVPTIQSAWTSVVRQQLRISSQEALRAYRLEMDKCQELMPMNEDELRDRHKAAKAEALRVFLAPRFQEDDPRMQEYREQLLSRIKQQYEVVKAENMGSSRRLCEATAMELYAAKIQSRLNNKDGYTSLEQLMQDWDELRQVFSVRTRGPAQAEILGSWLFQRMTENVQQVSGKLKSELVERKDTKGSDGSTYRGQWMGDHKHGKGVLTRKDGQVYEGTFVESRAHGYGTITTKNGDKYVGQWVRDQLHGYGKFTQVSGSCYEGEWVANEKNGKGIEFWPDGAKYEGLYARSLKHGDGMYISGKGAQYDGQFKNDLMDGKGRYTSDDGCVLTGTWEAGHLTGQGEAVWPDGSRYIGGYDRDLRNGEGVLTWPDGRMYKGQWARGKMNGVGFLMDAAGRETQGVWRDGEQISGETTTTGTWTGNWKPTRPGVGVPKAATIAAGEPQEEIPPPPKNELDAPTDLMKVKVKDIDDSLSDDMVKPQAEKPSGCRCG